MSSSLKPLSTRTPPHPPSLAAKVSFNPPDLVTWWTVISIVPHTLSNKNNSLIKSVMKKCDNGLKQLPVNSIGHFRTINILKVDSHCMKKATPEVFKRR